MQMGETAWRGTGITGWPGDEQYHTQGGLKTGGGHTTAMK